MYEYICEVESLCDNKTPRGFCSLTAGKCWNAASRHLETTKPYKSSPNKRKPKSAVRAGGKRKQTSAVR